MTDRFDEWSVGDVARFVLNTAPDDPDYNAAALIVARALQRVLETRLRATWNDKPLLDVDLYHLTLLAMMNAPAGGATEVLNIVDAPYAGAKVTDVVAPIRIETVRPGPGMTK